VKTSRVYVRDCSTVPAMALLLFGGSLSVVHEEGVVLVDGWIRVKAAAQTAVLVKQLRAALAGLLERLVREPERALGQGSSGAQLVEAIVGLLRDAEAEAAAG
jgi:ATP-dependent RNA helicase DHX29